MPRIVYLVTEDWYFVSHRLPMARAARDAGYDVHVVTRVDRHADAITREGFTLHPADLRRGSTRPDHLAAAVAEVRRRYRDIRPDILHHVALQGVVVGELAATGLGIPAVDAVTGVGTTFTSMTGLAPRLLAWLLPRLVGRKRSVALVQNPDDRDLLADLGVERSRIALIPGSGVDTQLLLPLPQPDGPVTFAYVGRMLEDKGIRTLIEAHRRLRAAGRAPRLILAGTPDPHNPKSLSHDEMRAVAAEPGIEWRGHVEDIATVWRDAHVAVLPSRREGLPKSLLEAAACGRALIASDVPGCREVARAGENALLFPVDEPGALAERIDALATDDALRGRFGMVSRRLAVEEFSAERIGRDVVALYGRLLARRPD